MHTTTTTPTARYEAAGYTVDILVQGYPGKSVCHGSLGWSTIALLRGHGRVALIDVGSFGVRGTLIAKLADHGLSPESVTDVILTHSHYDHAINWTLFAHAQIHMGGEEMDWSLKAPWGRTPVPELYMATLADWPSFKRLSAGDAPIPNLTAHAAPGHTPGHLIFILDGVAFDIVFTGDAAKNRAELLSMAADMSLDKGESHATFERIWAAWRAKLGSVLVPGHDLPMRLGHDGTPQYLGDREGAIRAWFGENLEQTHTFRLVV
jgi:N-acyl homoserine lactone hydrolase